MSKCTVATRHKWQGRGLTTNGPLLGQWLGCLYCGIERWENYKGRGR